VSGPIVLEDMAGQPFGLAGRTAISLCRCGHSENKPFCDGSHNRAGFKSEVAARELPPPVPKP
jgi:CDGSH-type Zn-finger protein